MGLVSKPIFVIQKDNEMTTNKAKTEIACSLSWFRHWTEHQRHEFAQLLLEKNQDKMNNDEESIENLLGTMNQMSLENTQKEGPSVFECQLRIFSKWHHSWNPSDRADLVIQLNQIAPEFVAFLNRHSTNS